MADAAAHLCAPALTTPAPGRAHRRKAPRKLDNPPPKPIDGTITLAEQERLRNALFRLTCSDTWAQDIRDNITGGKNGVPGPRIPYKSSGKMAKELDARGVYPPGGKADTLMRECTKCHGRFFPPQYIVSDPRVCPDGWCSECVENRRAPRNRDKEPTGPIDEREIWAGPTTESPIAIAAMELEKRGVVVEERPLLTEDDAELKRMCDEQRKRLLKGLPVVIIEFNDPRK